MKKTLGLSLVILLCCGSLALAEMNLQVNSSSAVKLFKTYTTTPSSVKLKKRPPMPASLSKIQLQSAITQLQKKAGGPSISVEKLIQKKITLTPNRPMVDDNFFNVFEGVNHSHDNYASTHKIPGYDNGCFSFNFKTIPGKTYLVDFALNNITWLCWGAISGEIQPMNGHLLAGFTATKSTTSISMMPLGNEWGDFFSVQLIPVN